MRLYHAEYTYIGNPNTAVHDRNLALVNEEMRASHISTLEAYSEAQRFKLPSVPLWCKRTGLARYLFRP